MQQRRTLPGWKQHEYLQIDRVIRENTARVARVLRTKTHVTREAVALAANGLPAKYPRDVFAGTGLRPPLKASLEAWGEGLEAWELVGE